MAFTVFFTKLFNNPVTISGERASSKRVSFAPRVGYELFGARECFYVSNPHKSLHINPLHFYLSYTIPLIVSDSPSPTRGEGEKPDRINGSVYQNSIIGIKGKLRA
jgi:hypothetical protein